MPETLEEQRKDFETEIDERYADFLKTSQSIPWAEMRHYLECRKRGEKPLLPKARS